MEPFKQLLHEKNIFKKVMKEKEYQKRIAELESPLEETVSYSKI